MILVSENPSLSVLTTVLSSDNFP